METPILNDPDQFPTEELIFTHIGKTRAHWEMLFDHIKKSHPDFSEEWRYYNDGKSWLLKVTRKSKTIFWLSILEGVFRTTFYFTNKAREAITGSSLSHELKEQFSGKTGLRGITVVVRNKKDIGYIKELIDIKLSVK
jgi:hypothetical protein